MGADAEYRPQAERFAAAADVLEGNGKADGRVSELLGDLGYLDGDQAAVPHRAALLRVAARFPRLFKLRADHAPGLVALGAEASPDVLGVAGVPPGAVSGTGATLQQAFESCVGEGVEYLSQFAQPGDVAGEAPADAPPAEAPADVRSLWERIGPLRRPTGRATVAWARAADMADGRPVPLPADICYRRADHARDFDIGWPLGTGCAAGPGLPEAALHALLELIERDAVTLWWRGGARARVMPPDAGSGTFAAFRGGAKARRTWLLDITSDIGVPVAAALSCNADGMGLCVGTASRPTAALAIDAALRELLQMELAHQLAETKRRVRGEAALNDTDRRHIRRYGTIDAAATPALQPLAPPGESCDVPQADTIGRIAAVRARLGAAGMGCYAVDLTRPPAGRSRDPRRLPGPANGAAGAATCRCGAAFRCRSVCRSAALAAGAAIDGDTPGPNRS